MRCFLAVVVVAVVGVVAAAAAFLVAGAAHRPVLAVSTGVCHHPYNIVYPYGYTGNPMDNSEHRPYNIHPGDR